MAKILMVSLLAVAIPVRPDRHAPPTPPPLAPANPLLGEWRFVKVSLAGLADVPGGIGDKALHITATEMVPLDKGVANPKDATRYTVDWTRQPATLDMAPNQAGNGKKVEGILKIEGDQLTLCLAIEGQRPANFNIPPGAGKQLMIMMHLQRIK
jgi:uncharacterized protein (TIGR03067 family)